jgi:peptidoglycan/LPS O-acetylase OafA/YrhL
MKKANNIEVIDFIRGYSILTIVLFHFFQNIEVSPMFSAAIRFGGTGIHTFLFASGFGLYLSYLKKPLGYLDFLKKRFGKIYIPYILVVTISALISLFVPIYENNWNNYFSHVFLYKMFDSQLIGTYGYQLWFISTIIQFYLLFPLIVILRKWMPGNIFLVTGLLIFLAWGALVLMLQKDDLRNWNSFFLAYLWEFMLGMYCAELYLKQGFEFWRISISRLVIVAAGGLIIYAVMGLKGGPMGRIFNDLPALFGYGALCILIYRLKIGLVNRFIFFTAKLSFAIFLIHFLVMNLVREGCLAIGLPWTWLMLFPTLLICYIIAVPFQQFIDYLIDAMLTRHQARSASASLPS